MVGPTNCLSDPDLCAPYEVDWTRRWQGRSALVVRPRTTGEVVDIVRLCGQHGFPIVAQGGNTGLVGGGVPRSGEVVLSLANLNLEVTVDATSRRLEAGAGVSLARAQEAAVGAGLDVGIDLASRDTATLGGMAATNAGGVHVLRYGTVRTRLAGLQVVLANGTVVDRMRGLVKDNVGYDLISLFAGSEGTLGIITRVALHLVPLLPHRATVLLALRSLPGAGGAVAAAVSVLADLLNSVDGIEAAELLLPAGMALVCSHIGLPPPEGASAQAFLLVEAAGWREPMESLAAAVGENPLVMASSVATDRVDRLRLWAYRERQTEAIATLGIVRKFDVSLAVGHLAAFWGELLEVTERVRPHSRTICFGHLGDGNLHVSIAGIPIDDTEVDRVVLDLVIAHNGSISAEHGLGVAKRDYLLAARGEADVTAMLAIKTALDPAGLFNPGVIFPLPT
ncbi:MAG: FAD-binding oxidoreductase [Candidatus Dormibacteria bacterium]